MLYISSRDFVGVVAHPQNINAIDDIAQVIASFFIAILFEIVVVFFPSKFSLSFAASVLSFVIAFVFFIAAIIGLLFFLIKFVNVI